MLKKLLSGLKKFDLEVYPEKKALYEQLALGQHPHTLFITCSDSRIDPNLITQSNPGDIFIVRNAGNIIPPHGSSESGEEASIEFAVEALGVKNIVVCGHSRCGAIGGLSNPGNLEKLPAVKRWLLHADATKRRCQDKKNATLDEMSGENVLVQIENLKTHPSVSAALEAKRLHIFGWLYFFDTGEVKVYDPKNRNFIPASDLAGKTDEEMSFYSN